ncbi:hypothetical protein CR194_13420 [Salipaludibacillus keqinensis]|uniref:Phosphatidic acid phosphatase type 2/haloperoxidase domain-containing protein n=1 Tax=Salipaludibacillus keqinensis TaxID=2045207 RepID=A0A323TBY4_9BACI|nr:phosphatase PAP2 family protein [Salipaludibacillus keqinensis]PYZ92661.1 hypothetical protein CR194_13420 [Salipaludibacillus keqinensis]
MLEAIIDADKRLFERLNQEYYIDWLDPIVVFLTAISDVGLFWWVIAAILFLFHKRVGGFVAGRTLALSVGIVFILQSIINQFVPRPRPPLSEEGVRLLIEPPLSSSFPSAHAATSFAAMTTLVYFFPSAKFWAVPLGIVFAYSRLYVGVHFPIDTVAGSLLGILTAAIIIKISQPRGRFSRSVS